MTDEDRPPEHIWMDDEALTEHFERLSDHRRNPDRGDRMAVPEADMTSNELTAHLKR